MKRITTILAIILMIGFTSCEKYEPLIEEPIEIIDTTVVEDVIDTVIIEEPIDTIIPEPIDTTPNELVGKSISLYYVSESKDGHSASNWENISYLSMVFEFIDNDYYEINGKRQTYEYDDENNILILNGLSIEWRVITIDDWTINNFHGFTEDRGQFVIRDDYYDWMYYVVKYVMIN